MTRTVAIAIAMALALLGCACSSGEGGHRDAAGGGGSDAGAEAGLDAALDTAPDVMTFAVPTAVQVPSASAPANLPPDLFVGCIDSSNTVAFSDACWVLKWGNWTYWVLTHTDSRLLMVITPFDAAGTIAPGTEWPKARAAARYVQRMSVDDDAQTVTIVGQSDNSVTVSWADLHIDQPFVAVPPADGGADGPAGDADADAAAFVDPTAVEVPVTSTPTSLPAGAAVRCVISASDTTASSTCWVVKWGRWTYWAFSYADNRSSFLITPYDATGTAAGQAPWPLEKPGARYLWHTSVDTGADTVTFSGQAGGDVVMPWSDLRIDQP